MTEHSLSDHSSSVSVCSHPLDVSSVWSMDCSDRLIVLGCSSGRVEVWDARSAAFKVRSNGCQTRNPLLFAKMNVIGCKSTVYI